MLWIMTMETVFAILHSHRPELERRGIEHVSLFGSTARRESRPDSDIDLLVDLAKDKITTIYDYVDVKLYIESLFDRPVDVVARENLRLSARSRVETDAIPVF